MQATARADDERLERGAERLAEWRLNPSTMVRNEFRVEPDPWQDRALQRFADAGARQRSGSPLPTDYRQALKACKGPGKSAVLSWIVLNFAATRPHSKIAVTSITGDNLKDGLWAELGKWRSRSGFFKELFEYGATRISYKRAPDNWFVSARQWSKNADADQQETTLAGLHADYILMIVDESGGVPDAVVDAAEGALSTGIECHLVIAGNPTHTEGPLWRACKFERDLWDVTEITGDPEREDRAPRVSIDWARHQIRKYGRRSPWVQVNVFGEFPTSTTEGLVTIQEILDAFGREYAYTPTVVGYDRETRGPVLDQAGELILGLDVARRGSNVNVLTVRRGDFVLAQEEWSGQDLTWTAGHARERFEELGAARIYVDDIGVGGGVTDILAQGGVAVVPVNVSTPAGDTESHINLRSELAESLQARFRSGRISIAPEIREETSLVTQATTLRFAFDQRGRRKLEDKDQYKRRTGRSPDHYDSLALTEAEFVHAPGEGASSDDRELERGTVGRITAERVDPDEDAGEWRPRRTRVRLGGTRRWQ
jgi:hypothetical protein